MQKSYKYMNFSEYANNEAAFLRLRVVPSEKALPLRGPLPVCRGRTLFRGNIDSAYRCLYFTIKLLSLKICFTIALKT